MLVSNVLIRGIRAQVPSPFTWVSATRRLSSNAGSSSDSSSDSDSDTERKAIRERLDDKDRSISSQLKALQYQSNRERPSRTIDVALQPRVKGEKRISEPKSHIQQLVEAARNVATTMKKDVNEVTSDLMNKVTEMQNANQKSKEKSVIYELIQQKREQQRSQWEEKQSVLHRLKAEHRYAENNAEEKYAESSVPLTENLFNEISAPSQDIPQLKIWKMMEEREMKLLVTHPPSTVFEELIQWTEQGKLWKFPIDNEQGMEEEQNVHFSEHVFMERHLKGWCPKKGPIRHFMELVCVGLSKNPYMTVEEKIAHIMWYKNYFAEQQELLEELGAIEAPISTPTEKIKA